MAILKAAAVYCGLKDYPLEQNKAYVKKLKEAGCNFLFTSFHMPEQVGALEELKELLKVTDSLKLPVVVDVSNRVMGEFDLFDQVILRLDYGFTLEEVAKMSNEYQVLELNASTMTKDYLENLKANHANFSHLRVSHNFYPKRYTGLSLQDVANKNKLYHEYGLQVIGYLPSNSGKRPPLYMGLPTVEAHRNAPLALSISELIAASCDGVCVGDAYLSEEDLAVLANLNTENLEIPIEVYSNVPKEILEALEAPTRFRIDESPILRRTGIKVKSQVAPFNTKSPVLGDITIDNELLKRYMGEVDIFKTAAQNQGDMNIIGHILPEYQNVWLMLDSKQKFKFKIVGVIHE